MLLFLKDQFNSLSYYLPKFKLLPVISYDISQLKEKKTISSVPCNKELKELSFNFFFDYNIFPNNILTYCAEWKHSKQMMQKGDIIVQQIYLPPVKIVSQKVIVGVKIKDIFKQDDLIGFSYETLKGHIEKGVSSFIIFKTKGTINFAVHTYSKANNLLIDLISPLFSSPYQDYCTNKALQKIIKLFKDENSAALDSK